MFLVCCLCALAVSCSLGLLHVCCSCCPDDVVLGAGLMMLCWVWQSCPSFSVGFLFEVAVWLQALSVSCLYSLIGFCISFLYCSLVLWLQVSFLRFLLAASGYCRLAYASA
eukprot:TRINITY_DN7648_c0_g1_i1.p1 TRINITY_DN7648_c0_g1~~TRINITY_DN7648_c0_g1_i1.p1  ORF type:complete len:111 (-),score=17.06 TRINITY_DN7648_c0_g1_i1:59-391(-)